MRLTLLCVGLSLAPLAAHARPVEAPESLSEEPASVVAPADASGGFYFEPVDRLASPASGPLFPFGAPVLPDAPAGDDLLSRADAEAATEFAPTAAEPDDDGILADLGTGLVALAVALGVGMRLAGALA